MNLPTSLPVPLSPTFDVHDASKTDTFMRCPRKYFYSYVLGWRYAQPNKHLIHGEAWHRAQEILLTNGFDLTNVADAIIAYETYYREHFPDRLTDIDRYPKSPDGAREAIVSYIKQYRHQEFNVIATEIAGSVPVSSQHRMHFRLDSIVYDDLHVYSMDHKTSSSDRQTWRDSFTLSPQMSLYTHVLYSIQGLVKEISGLEIYGMIVNGTVFLRASAHKHIRLKIRKHPADMKTFLWNVNHYLNMIELEFERLSTCSDSDETLNAFPMCTTSCTDYGGCPFFDYCTAVQNPLRLVERTPADFKVEHWDPRRYADERAKLRVEDGHIVTAAIAATNEEDENDGKP